MDMQKSLHAIIEYLKKQEEPVRIDSMLEHLGLHTGSVAAVQRLRDAMLAHDKLSVEDSLVVFKPVYCVRNFEELLALLRDFDSKGLGGVRVDLLKESYKTVMADVDRLIAEQLVYVVKRKAPKTDVIFYRSPQHEFFVSESIQALWRQCEVAARHVNEIEKLLVNAGQMPQRVEFVALPERTKKTRGRTGPAIKHESMAILEKQGIAPATPTGLPPK